MSAMSLNVGGLRTSVVINGYEAIQFGTEINKNWASSWMVLGEENASFSIYAALENLPEYDNYVVRMFLDDIQVGKTIIRPTRPRGCYFSSVRISQYETRQFLFGRVEMPDEDVVRRPPWTEATGTIKITLTRALHITQSRLACYGYGLPNAQASGSGDTFNCIQYAKSKINEERNDAVYFRVRDEVHLSTHIIRYRPIAMLQKVGIVPCPPVPRNIPSLPNLPSLPNSPTTRPISPTPLPLSKKRKTTGMHTQSDNDEVARQEDHRNPPKKVRRERGDD